MNYLKEFQIMGLIRCPKCGHNALDKSTKCPNCGYIFKPQKVRPVKTPKKKVHKQTKKQEYSPTTKLYYTLCAMFLILGMSSSTTHYVVNNGTYYTPVYSISSIIFHILAFVFVILAIQENKKKQ
jgi:ribosomal protein L37E